MSLTLRKFQFATGLGMLLITCLANVSLYAQQGDTTRTDTTRTRRTFNPYRPSYQQRDRYGDPFSNYSTVSPFYLKNPKSLNQSLEMDTSMNYTISERMGNINYRPQSTVTFNEYGQQQNRVMMKDYWQSKSRALDGESAVSSRNLIPKIYISPVLDRIFGGSYVELIPRGFVTLDFGAQFQKIENPAIPIRQQKNGGFEFDQQINLNVTGKVGEKLQVTTNFDNNNSFDFQNNFKVEYTGFKEDILKKLELGNVSLPLNNSLITGAQNLFGIKTQMQFGKLFVTSIATTQRGKQSSIVIQGNANGTTQGRPFEIVGSNYDENRNFFLSQFFRDNFEKWLSTLPQITSGVNITRVELYLVNRANDTQTQRNVVGFMDMGEAPKNVYRSDLINNLSGYDNAPASNANNTLFSVHLNSINRNSDAVSSALDAIGFVASTDYAKLNSARKLAATEFTFHKELGYITLQRKLQNDEALAVAFEYTYNGRIYKVGELTEDYANLEEDKAVFLKLLRPPKINIKDKTGRIIPTWNLMMKNIYSLNVSGLTRDGFQLRVIYRDDRTGIDNPQLQEGDVARTKQLIEVVGLDRLNPYNDPQPDGNFDYVDKITVIPETGLIVFPYLEPFNTPLRNLFKKETNTTLGATLTTKYVYDTLYHTTKAEAELVATKNKFWLTGTFRAGSGKEIIIQGFNIAQGSVKVYAGGTPLMEGSDYTVDYTFGKVTILNEGILSSGKDITINYEQQDPFAFQTRSLLGSRFDYKLNDDVNLGGTLLYYNERPLITRNAIGNEPARNLQYGVDLNMKKESRFLTKMVDALPFLQTKEKSTINVNAEFAQLLPGTSNKIDGEGTSFLDDFENSATPYSLMSPINWKLAAVPTSDARFDLANGVQDNLMAGYKRAKLAWYQVDNIFYRENSSYKPKDINVSNHYVRPVLPREIAPNFDPFVGNFFEPIFDMAYYPSERGQYNFNPNLNSDGSLRDDPRGNWAGVTSAIRSEVDFDKANIEYVEFWLMNPFIGGTNGTIDDGRGNVKANTTGGKLVFQLGSISEDVMRDGKHAFENGLPADGSTGGEVQSTAWGNVTTQQFLNSAFSNSSNSRPNQDVGLDGLNNSNEAVAFKTFVDATPQASSVVLQDPAADDFKYFLGDDLDAKNAQILERYKNFNGLENNSPILSSSDPYTKSGTNLPDNEDLNLDNTLSDLEEYYTYNIDLKPGLEVGQKYIVDKITPVDAELKSEVTWYLFRIPVRDFEETKGAITDFKSIKYVRMFMHGFSEPVVLRMARFRAIGNKWRRYTENLQEAGFSDELEPPDKFTVSTVNIEENSKGNEIKPSYVEPLDRDRDVTSTVQRRLNEQSVQLCATDLKDGDARAIYKNVSSDLFNYGRIKMFLSAYKQLATQTVDDNQITAFLRLGSDFDENYYEIELPLKITAPKEQNSRAEVWPEENQIDLDLNELYALKAQRDRDSYSLSALYPQSGPKMIDRHGIRILGRPDLSSVKLMMIGVRNPRSADGKEVSVCIWADELRLTDFDRSAGWAANAVVSAKLADLGTVTGSFRHIGFGYGGVQSKISERARGETNAYDVSANINVDKLLPKALGLKIPMFASYENTTINPKYDPANPDTRLDAALKSFNTEDERQAYLKLIQDRTERRSLNFTNVRRVKTNPQAVSHIYDIENFSFTYAYSEAKQTNFNLIDNTKKSIRGAVAWQYSPKFKGFEPFKDMKAFSSPFLQLIKDFNFNPLPTSISVRGELDRSFSKLVYRNSVSDQQGSLPNYSKYFVFNRYYNARWSLSKALTLDYAATVNAIIDEPDGDIDTPEKRAVVKENLQKLGRMKNFTQNVTANYTLPLDKFPVTNWLGADYRYNVGYSWRAGPLETVDSLKMGNIIQNTQDQAINGKMDLVKLYNKVSFLKSINTPKRKPTALEKAKQKPAAADTLKKPFEPSGALRGILRLIMSLRSIQGTYTLTQGTILPGFTETPYMMGMNKGRNAPGWGFVFGSQDPNLRFKLADKYLITENTQLTTPFSQLQTKDISIRASLEPSNDFKIQLDVKKTANSAYQEIYRRDSIASVDPTRPFSDYYNSLSESRSGSYKISIVTIRTAFKNNNSTESTVFQQFTNNITTIRDRFGLLPQKGYGEKSQDILIPAFIAAYSGKNAQTVGLTPFPSIPIPNWRVDYNGLNKLDLFKDVFQSITLSHAYTSSYQVMNYSNSLEYEDIGLNVPVEQYNKNVFASKLNASNELIPIYVISQVLISEQFAPLIGINFRTKKKLNMRFDYKTKRDLALNMSNAQITELSTRDWSVEVGYTKNNLKLPFKDQGRVITLKNDVTFRLNMSISDNRTIQRKIEDVNTVTNGNINIQVRPNIQYVVNQKLNIQLYMDRNVNEPLVSNSFRRTTTKVGTKIVFNLAQ